MKFACPEMGCQCYDCGQARQRGLTDDSPLLVDDRSELPWYAEYGSASGGELPKTGPTYISVGKGNEKVVVRPLQPLPEPFVVRHHLHSGIDGQPVFGSKDWFDNIRPIDYEKGDTMYVYTGAVVQTTEEGYEIVYTEGEFLAKNSDQAKKHLFAAAVREDESLDPATLTVHYSVHGQG